MTMVLNHTIVPSSNKRESARFFADLTGLSIADPSGPFVPVHVNDQLTLDFDDRNEPAPGHYAFLVDDDTFNHILHHAQNMGVDFGPGPEHGWNRSINHLAGGRGVYVRDPDGHSYEFFTRAPLTL